MAGITSEDTIVDRVVAVLRQYLAANITINDTRNNAVAGAGSDNHFTTPSIASTDIQAYLDTKKGSAIRVIVTAEGSASNINEGMQFGYAAQDGSTEPTATEPRIDRQVRFGVSVRVKSAGGSQTTAGGTSAHHARRVCNRVADAVTVTLYRYPFLNIPATSTAGIVNGGLGIVSDSRATEVGEDSVHYYQRDQVYEATTRESRS
jgi:hypothetical protein